MAFAWKSVLTLVTAFSVALPSLASAEPSAMFLQRTPQTIEQENNYRRQQPDRVRQYRPDTRPGPVYRDRGYREQGDRYGGRGYQHQRYEDDGGDAAGAALAAGVIGLALGAMAAGASRDGNSHVRRCMNRYRSYDPDTDTYIGRDGRAHRCR